MQQHKRAYALSVLAAVVLGCCSVVSAQEKEPLPRDAQRLIDMFETTFSLSRLEGRVALLQERYKYDHEALGLLLERKRYPEADRDFSERMWGVHVAGVWKGSPADRAGIRPGDWLEKVGSGPVLRRENSDDEDSPVLRILLGRDPDDAPLHAFAERLIRQEGNKVKLQIRRNGSLKDYHLKKEVFGDDVVRFIDERRIRWMAMLQEVEPQIMALHADIEAIAGRKEKMTTERGKADMEKVSALFAKVNEPWIELGVYVTQHIWLTDIPRKEIFLPTDTASAKGYVVARMEGLPDDVLGVLASTRHAGRRKQGHSGRDGHCSHLSFY